MNSNPNGFDDGFSHFPHNNFMPNMDGLDSIDVSNWHIPLEKLSPRSQQRMPFFPHDGQFMDTYQHHVVAEESAHAAPADGLGFEPRFHTVFMQYVQHHPGIMIDPSQPLLRICLDNLIPFCCWTRDNPATSAWVRSALFESVDLRPEVRNGIALVIIYTFSAAKSAAKANNISMFSILQDPEDGFGIVNKTSLKVYNDPYNCFAFLKCCISGLIDAGVIPENERQNQPKKARRQTENKAEVAAFHHVKGQLFELIDRRDHDQLRYRLQQIIRLWQRKSKSIRNQRFATALSIFNQPYVPETVAESSYSNEHYEDMDDEDDVNEPETSRDQHLESASETDPPREIISPRNQQPKKRARTNSNPNPVIFVLKFERVGLNEWHIESNKIYDIDSFLPSITSTIFLLDESMLPEEEWKSKRFVGRSEALTKLYNEFFERNLLVTCWPQNHHVQFQNMIHDWYNNNPCTSQPTTSLLSFWEQGLLQSNRTKSQGIIAYEVVDFVGIVIRSNAELGITQDVWRVLYPKDLAPGTLYFPLHTFVVTFFPQLRSALASAKQSMSEVVIKYASHEVAIADCNQPPKPKPRAAYQTIGLLDSATSDILSRFASGNVFHDLILEVSENKTEVSAPVF